MNFPKKNFFPSQYFSLLNIKSFYHLWVVPLILTKINRYIIIIKNEVFLYRTKPKPSMVFF